MRALFRLSLTALLVSRVLALGAARAAARAPLALWVLAEGSERTLESPEKIATLVERAEAARRDRPVRAGAPRRAQLVPVHARGRRALPRDARRAIRTRPSRSPT